MIDLAILAGFFVLSFVVSTLLIRLGVPRLQSDSAKAQPLPESRSKRAFDPRSTGFWIGSSRPCLVFVLVFRRSSPRWRSSSAPRSSSARTDRREPVVLPARHVGQPVGRRARRARCESDPRVLLNRPPWEPMDHRQPRSGSAAIAEACGARLKLWRRLATAWLLPADSPALPVLELAPALHTNHSGEDRLDLDLVGRPAVGVAHPVAPMKCLSRFSGRTAVHLDPGSLARLTGLRPIIRGALRAGPPASAPRRGRGSPPPTGGLLDRWPASGGIGLPVGERA